MSTKSLKQIRLLYLVSNLGTSGPTNQLYNLIYHLSPNLFETTLVTLSPEPALSSWNKFQSLRLKMHSLGLSRVSGVILNKGRLHRLLNAFRPDIIHSQGIRSDYLNSRLNQFPNRVATQRNNPLIDYPLLYGKISGQLMANFHLRLLKHIPQVITCSQSISETNNQLGLRSRFISNGIRYTPNHRELERNEKLALRIKLGLPVSGMLFVWAGPVIPRKMPETAISAFNFLPTNNDSYLCLLGDGPLQASCVRATRSKNVIFRGYVNNVGDYLNAADGFISTSLSEGMPNSVLESLAYGVPVILSDIAPHQEILSYSNKAGVLYPLRDAKKLAEVIQNSNFTKTNSDAARSIITKHLNSKTMSTNYQNLYFALMKNS
ncbi:MAG: glycosyltransferase [Candidatus Poribacteria bacterium]|nr:glycosyltransferase [Candidatus Poribacteria bacterium]